jgi:voltage-gated potassium channel Kch
MKVRALSVLRNPAVATLVILLTVIAGATGVYMVSEGWGFLTALIFTLATVTTVGYGNVYPHTRSGEVFTAGLMIVALSVVVVTLSTYASRLILMVARGMSPVEKNNRAVSELRDHVVVVADGTLTPTITQGLQAKGIAFVVLTDDEPTHERLLVEGVPVVFGDPDDEQVLRRAGVERAAGLIAARASDAENVFVSLSAHDLNPQLRIAARAHSPSAIMKLRRSGADEVILPDQVTAMNLVNLFEDRTRASAMVRQVTEELRQSLQQCSTQEGSAQPQQILFQAVRLALQELSPDMAGTLYALGEQLGREAVGPNLAGPALCDVLTQLEPRWSAAGLGEIHVTACQETGAVLQEGRCSTCQGMPNVGRPVCHLERGVLAGALEVALGRTVAIEETKCWGLGSGVCEFRVTTESHAH